MSRGTASSRARDVLPSDARGLAPRAWLVWSFAAVTVALSTDNPVYRGLVALAALNVLLTWLLPGRRVRPLALALFFAAGMATLINVLASHTGADVIARLPGDWPLVGGTLTVESLAFGGVVGLGLAAALLAVAPLSLVLEPHDIVDAMPRRLERMGIAVATSLNLVSGFARTFTEVGDAQRMRGWKPRGLRSWNEVLVPVVLTAIEDSVMLAEAMEARGFGSGPRTGYAVSSWRRRDVAIAASATAVAALFIGLRLAGVAVDWYPYPTLYLPPINPVLVAGCLALALPSLAGTAPRPSGLVGRPGRTPLT
jgi:energy-coupling factor transport system permease protein